MNAEQPDISPGSTEMEVRYQRAQALMHGYRTESLIQNDRILPHWIEHTPYFWYVRTYKIDKEPSVSIGKQYRLVNAKAWTNEPAFDQAALATALANAAGKEVNVKDLPISQVSISLSPLIVRFSAFNQHWQFDGSSATCKAVKVNTIANNEALSPDGKQIAFTRANNLWVRELDTGKEWALTHDGEDFFSYATPGTAYGVPWGLTGPGAAWSPDSQRLFTVQRDTRQVKTTPMVNHVPTDGGIRPTVEHVKIAYPGDDNVEEYRLLAIDVANDKVCAANYRRIPVSHSDRGFFSVSRLGWWAKDSRRTYFIDQERGDKVARLVEFNTDTGATRILFEESSVTHINIKPEAMDTPHHVILTETNELIWWSERSGWGHLYLYELDSGELKYPITTGDWRVRDILHVDTERRELWIQTTMREAGRNPYYRDICRVNIDTGELTTLLSTNDEYTVPNMTTANPLIVETAAGVSPDGQYVVATRSRVDQVPVSLLLNRDGEILLEVETADISSLPEGWQWPESVKLTAADGKTDIYGLLFRPPNFSEDQQYPVINMIVGGPWFSAVPHGSFHNGRGYADRHYFQGAALAELGFMVVVIDSRGTPLRDKAFQDISYGWIPSGANTADHRVALEQLAARYPSINLNRVGVYSPTGYQGAIQNLMECPDFYKVGVINMYQDNRLVSCAIEGDKYQGVNGPAKDKPFPEQLAEHWQGKLLLIHAMHGYVIPCYPPAGTFRLVDALQKANKDFDQLMLPYANYIMSGYELRRAWDYLIRHLQGIEPPKEFQLDDCFK